MGLEKEKNSKVDVEKRANRLLYFGCLVILVLLGLGFVVHYLTTDLKAYSLAMLLFIVCVVVGNTIGYKYRKGAYCRYVVFVNMIVVYSVSLFKASNDLQFCMAFPVMIMFLLYFDFKFNLVVTTAFGLVIIADVVHMILAGGISHGGHTLTPEMIMLEVLATLVFAVTVDVTTVISNDNNSHKIGQIKSVADKITSSIGSINSQLGNLNESSRTMNNAMSEISSGVSDTADAVQTQAAQTEEIQEQIEGVRSVASNISVNVKETMQAVEEGNKDVGRLVADAESSVEIGQTVVDNLNSLKDRMEDMSDITKMIESIAFQTNIMALNANVEAARAGEAGRGFAVVATEISNMANKTSEATDNIADLINNTAASLNELVYSVNDLTEKIRVEKEMTNETSIVFEQIKNNTISVEEQIDTFVSNMESVANANRNIMNSVQTISAVSEQVSALTQEAVNTEKSNLEALGEIAKEVEILAEDAE